MAPDKVAPSPAAPGSGEEPTSPLPAAADFKPRACYRDLEWQLLRSRQVVAGAPCGLAGPATPTGRFGLLAAIADGLVSWMNAPCGAPAPPEKHQGPTLQTSGPIAIPVVETDFATAYLFGRLGVGAAGLFFASQAGLVAIDIWAYARIARERRGSRIEIGARRFLAVVVAGSVLLFILQWMLSWSNTLGLFPVIGQPMSMLSYAVSHHLFAALPHAAAVRHFHRRVRRLGILFQ